MNKVLLFDSPFKDRIWGSDYFKNNYDSSLSETIGEMWSLSAYPGDESKVLEGEYKGLTLKELYENHFELFGGVKHNEFPILIKLIATKDKLSVQVHPDDEYARINENDLGKTEGWLILGKTDNSSIVIGHNAKSYEELVNMVNTKEYDKLLREVKPNVGEFYPIPSGTVHALGKDLLLLEVQQSSNVTYRFYDYDRKDAKGNLRELHTAKAIEVTDIKPYKENIRNVIASDCIVWENKYFTVKNVLINGEKEFEAEDTYTIYSVSKEGIFLDEKELKLGSSFIQPVGCKFKVTGTGSLLVTKSK